MDQPNPERSCALRPEAAKRRKDALDEARARLRERARQLREKAVARATVTPHPRYDDVFSEGLAAMEQEAGPSLETWPADEQLRQLLAALSLNNTQAARVLRVRRPTLYVWIQGKEPNPANAERLQSILRVLARLGVTGTSPLNARFVRRSAGGEDRSLIDLLADENLDEAPIVAAVHRARGLDEEASRRRTEREERLAARGFEPVSQAERRENLARIMARKDWPKT